MILFEDSIRTKKVRAGVYAYKYRTGVIVINGQKYCLFSLNEAISKYRKDFPLRKRF